MDDLGIAIWLLVLVVCLASSCERCTGERDRIDAQVRHAEQFIAQHGQEPTPGE